MLRQSTERTIYFVSILCGIFLIGPILLWFQKLNQYSLHKKCHPAEFKGHQSNHIPSCCDSMRGIEVNLEKLVAKFVETIEKYKNAKFLLK